MPIVLPLNVQDDDGYTPLHEALRYRAAPEVILAMLEKGSPLNVQGPFGKTPLHDALRFDAAPEVILAMLEKGAPLDVQDNNGYSIGSY